MRALIAAVVDERALGALLEESNDLQSGAMREVRESLRELVERGQERRAHDDIDPDEARRFAIERNRLVRSGLLGAGAFAALGFGAALLARFDSPAFAQAGSDVQILQTAASLENLAIATYDVALTFDFVRGATSIPLVTRLNASWVTAAASSRPCRPACAVARSRVRNSARPIRS